MPEAEALYWCRKLFPEIGVNVARRRLKTGSCHYTSDTHKKISHIKGILVCWLEFNATAQCIVVMMELFKQRIK